MSTSILRGLCAAGCTTALILSGLSAPAGIAEETNNSTQTSTETDESATVDTSVRQKVSFSTAFDSPFEYRDQYPGMTKTKQAVSMTFAFLLLPITIPIFILDSVIRVPILNYLSARQK
ncbi:MAG: hypothetical protein Q3972_06135 [Corynebacterium sp.]|nr:hypothetical protein [Corynebacterium sp.]